MTSCQENRTAGRNEQCEGVDRAQARSLEADGSRPVAARSVEVSASSPKVTGKCIACGKRFDIDERMQADAREAGVAFSPCCMFPSVVEKVEVRRG